MAGSNGNKHSDPPGTETDETSAEAQKAGSSVIGSTDTNSMAEPDPKVVELQDRLLRALADADNARKRADRARGEGHRAGIADLAAAIVPALDSLDLAISTHGEVSKQEAEHPDALIEGLIATRREFVAALEKCGVQRIEPLGEQFDATRHEAVATRADTDTSPGRILEVMQCGYTVGDRLVRPPRVVVSAAPTTERQLNEQHGRE